MFHLKHDVQIHLKKEKEVFQFVRLFLFTFILSAVLMGLPDYIWNMHLYRISLIVVPWLIAVPSIVYCIKQRVQLVNKKWIFDFGIGVVIGVALSCLWLVIANQMGITVGRFYTNNMWTIVFFFIYYIFSVGPAEELIYRVAFKESLEIVTDKAKWIAPILANVLFGLSHLFQHNISNAVFAFCVGAIYTLLYNKWNKCNYIMVAAIHGMYDFAICFIPYMLDKV